jgi:hypothetical protein
MSRTLGRVALSASVATVAMGIYASSALATVTVGQIAPLNPPTNCSGASSDILQPTVTSGNSYVVKGDGTITSWSTSAQTGAGQMFKVKVFRKVADSGPGVAVYRAVGQDIFRPLASGVVNTFSVSIPVKAGDVLGNNRQGSTNCVFSVPGEEFWISPFTDLADGAQDEFSTQDGARANISAEVEPSNQFQLGAVTRNKKKGTAQLAITVPGPGELAVGGKGVKPAADARAVPVAAPGEVLLPIRSRGKKKRKLLDKGKVKLSLEITYTPTGGAAAEQATKLKLKKKL